jgi:hypothetical protein
MARTLEEIRADLDELLRHVQEHGARLQRDIEALTRTAQEKDRAERAGGNSAEN